MRQIHGRLAGRQRHPSSQGLSHRHRSTRLHPKNGHNKKLSPAAGSIAQTAAEYIRAQRHNPNTRAALRSLVAAHGRETPVTLTAQKVQALTAPWREFSAHTRSTYAKCLSRFLRWLEEVGAAPLGISRAVPRFNQPQPRLIIATDEERRRLLAGASPALRFFLLLCSDLGIRYRTAARIAITNYNPSNRSLTFTTKGNVHQTLPVTDAIADVIESLAPAADTNEPITNLLRPRACGE